MESNKKSVFITGGASGIGKALVEHYANDDYSVSFLDTNEKLGKQLEKELQADKVNAKFYPGDVTNAATIKTALEQTIAENGLDILINNAGYEGDLRFMADIDEVDFKKILDINVMGVFYGMKYVMRHFMSQKSGNIINLGSIAGIGAAPLMGAYGASKHAVIGMTKTAATEYGKFGIRINAICPTIVKGTAMSSPDDQLTEGMIADLTKRNPMRKLGEISDVVELIAFLTSDKAAFINGQAVRLDGGMYS